jgi:hypothetical protein
VDEYFGADECILGTPRTNFQSWNIGKTNANEGPSVYMFTTIDSTRRILVVVEEVIEGAGGCIVYRGRNLPVVGWIHDGTALL